MFTKSDATIEYCRVTDQLFDFLNLRSPFSKGYKTSIFKTNIQYLKTKVVPLVNYLYSLKYNRKYMFTTRKNFVLGFAIAIKSILEMSKSLFLESLSFTYVLAYTFSQDHIELLFGRIRRRFGSNNNPNIMQFKIAMKHISITYSTNNNCGTFDDDITASIFNYKLPKRENFIDHCLTNIDDDILNRAKLLNHVNSTVLAHHTIINSDINNCKSIIIFYISRYVMRKII